MTIETFDQQWCIRNSCDVFYGDRLYSLTYWCWSFSPFFYGDNFYSLIYWCWSLPPRVRTLYLSQTLPLKEIPSSILPFKVKYHQQIYLYLCKFLSIASSQHLNRVFGYFWSWGGIREYQRLTWEVLCLLRLEPAQEGGRRYWRISRTELLHHLNTKNPTWMGNHYMLLLRDHIFGFLSSYNFQPLGLM